MSIFRVEATGLALFFLGALSIQAQEHRKIMAPHAVQSDFIGPVKFMQEFSQGKNGMKEQTDEKTFSPSGDYLEVKSFDDGKVDGVTRHTYDPSSGTLVSSSEADGSGNVLHIISYDFDSRAKRITGTTKGAEDKVISVEWIAYNEKGLEMESRETDGSGMLLGTSQIQRGFDGKENKVQFNGADGKTKTEVEVRWDPKGYELSTLVSFLLGKNKGVKVLNEYSNVKLDAKGNWIERTETSRVKVKGENDEIMTETQTRMIEYYPD